MLILPPQSEAELLYRARTLAGLTVGQLAAQLYGQVKLAPYHKGWVGQLLELALGADAGVLPLPDFKALAVELKTLPLGNNQLPCEATFVTSINLLTIAQEKWHTCSVYTKLQRVLWFPIESHANLPVVQRRLGQALLWSPTASQLTILQQDWQELTDLIAMGNLQSISAHYGNYLQIRPKAANGKSLCSSINAQGERVPTLPRGFYLRARFTRSLLEA